MIPVYCKQGSEEWIKTRLGKITASNFNKIICSDLKGGYRLSKQAKKYMGDLLYESITGIQKTYYESYWMQRGKELEPEARDFYQDLKKTKVTEVGFVFLDEERLIGCSPDGFVSLQKGLEIKCPKTIDKSINDYYKTYKHQIQGSMYVTGFKEWDLLIYHPHEDHLLKTYKRDEEYIEQLEIYTTAFKEKYLDQLRSVA